MGDVHDDAFWQWRVQKEEKDFVDNTARHSFAKQNKSYTLSTLGVPVPVQMQLPPRPTTGLYGAGLTIRPKNIPRSAGGGARAQSFAGPFTKPSYQEGAPNPLPDRASIIASARVRGSKPGSIAPSHRSRVSSSARGAGSRRGGGSDVSYPATPNFSEVGTEADSEVIRRLDNLERALMEEKKRRQVAEKHLEQLASAATTARASVAGSGASKGGATKGLGQFGADEPSEEKRLRKGSGMYNPRLHPQEPTFGG